MIPGLYTRTGPARSPFTPSGLYFGTVKRVDEEVRTVWVEIPRLSPGNDFGPLNVLGAFPEVDDTVGCLFLEGRTNDIVVIGILGGGGTGGGSGSGSVIDSEDEGAVITMEIGP